MDAMHSLGSRYGDVVRSQEFAGLILTETTYQPDLKMPRHWHHHAHFYFVLQGYCTDSYGSTVQLCGPSALMFHPQGESHATCYPGTGARTFAVHLHPRWLERIREHSGSLTSPRKFERGLPVWIASRLSNELRAMDPVGPIAIEGLMLELLVEASRRHGSNPERQAPCWLRATREILHAQFAQGLSLEGIAEDVGVHPAHLAREFRRQYHCSGAVKVFMFVTAYSTTSGHWEPSGRHHILWSKLTMT